MVHVISIAECVDEVLRRDQLRLKRVHHRCQGVDEILQIVRGRAIDSRNRRLRVLPKLHQTLVVVHRRAGAVAVVAVWQAHEHQRDVGLRGQRVEHDLVATDGESRCRPAVGHTSHLGISSFHARLAIAPVALAESVVAGGQMDRANVPVALDVLQERWTLK